MKKRVLYILLGLIVVSNLRGAILELKSGSYSTSQTPSYNCAGVSFIINIPSGFSHYNLVIEKSDGSKFYYLPAPASISNSIEFIEVPYSPTINLNGKYSVEFVSNGGPEYPTNDDLISVGSNNLEIEIRPKPSKPTITSNSPICEGATLTFNATAVSGGTFSWTGVNSFVGSGLSPTIVAATTASTGNYSATVTVLGCTSPSSTISATVNAIPVAPTITSPAICEGQTATITAPAGTYTYTWTVPTGVVAPGNINTFTTTKAGTYSVTITNSNTCTSDVGAGTLVVNALPTVVASSSAITNQICKGENVMLIGSGADHYTWTGGAIDATDFAPTTTNTYFVTGTDNNGCENTDNIIITVNMPPVLSIISSSITGKVCEGDNITLKGAGASSYLFNNGVIDGVSFQPASTATYTVTGTDLNGCVGINSMTISVNALPLVVLDNPTTCEDTEVQIKATVSPGAATNYDYTWTVPTNATSANNYFLKTKTAGAYSVLVKDKTTSCESAIANGTVTVNPLPNPSATSPTEISVVETETVGIAIGATTGGIAPFSYAWIYPSGAIDITGTTNATIKGVNASPKFDITYKVTDANNCTAESAPIAVTVLPAIVIFKVPNVIIPSSTNDADNKLRIFVNARFKQEMLKSFQIFNRSGKLIYTFQGLNDAWDGRYGMNGPLQDADVYIWSASYNSAFALETKDLPTSGTFLILK